MLTCAYEHIFKGNPRNWFLQFWSTQKLAPKSVVQTDSGGEGKEQWHIGGGPFVLTLRYWLKDQKLDLVVKNHDFFCSQLQFYQLKFAHSIPSLLSEIHSSLRAWSHVCGRIYIFRFQGIYATNNLHGCEIHSGGTCTQKSYIYKMTSMYIPI